MGTGIKRSSERIELKTAIEVVGTDFLGTQFFVRTHTLVVSRHGGKFFLKEKLLPQQEITVRNLANGMEADASVVGQICNGTSDCDYGFKFLREEDNIWAIDFPPMTESDKAAGRGLMECMACKSQEMIYLDELELEVLEANGNLSRWCKRCGDVSMWRHPLGPLPKAEVTRSVPVLVVPEFQEKRKEARRDMKVVACVRTGRYGQDTIKTRNSSRGGLGFNTLREYNIREAIEVAVPFSPGGGNIFMPASIIWVHPPDSSGKWICGAAYRVFK